LEQSVNGTDVIRWITIVLLASLVFKYIMGLFNTPNRLGTVFEVRRWIENDREKPRTKTETWRNIDEHTWERKLGQYSLLLNFDYHPWNALSFVSLGLIEATRKGQKAGKKIKLADEVIMGVLSQFKENNGKLEN
jgi:hypothetical protein